MVITRSYRYRILPTATQEQKLIEMLAAHRKVYNAAIEQREMYWRQYHIVNTLKHGPIRNGLSCFEQTRDVKDFRREDPFLSQFSGNSYGLTLRRLDKAFTAFKKRQVTGSGRAGHPRYRSAHNFRSVEVGLKNGARVRDGRLYIMGVGEVAVRWHRPLPEGADLKQAVVRRLPTGRWEACIQLEMAVPEPPAHTGPSVGFDLGVLQQIVITDNAGSPLDGDHCSIAAPKYLDKELRRLRIAQRRVDRRKPKPGQKASRGYREAQQQVAKIHEEVACARRDWQHKTTRYLAETYGTMHVEKLSIAHMMCGKRLEAEKRKNTPSPNSNRKTKSRRQRRWLNRHVHDAAWGMMIQMLRYKAVEETGAVIVDVDPTLTTQLCSQCGERWDLAPEQREYRCSACGHRELRKVNAARNVRSRQDVASAEVVTCSR